MGPPQEQQIIEAHEDILKSMPLILRDNHNKEFIFDEKEVRLGRDQNSCHIFYEDKSISRNHASIWRIGPSYFIRDESSSNGTFVKLICGNHYQIVQNMHLEIPKVAEISIINVGLLQVKIKVNVEFEEESQKEFNVNLWGQQTWVIGSLQNQLVCEIADNAQTLDLQFCEIKQLGIKNVVKILKPEGFKFIINIISFLIKNFH